MNTNKKVYLSDTGAICHCDQRDAHEIAVYFTADELLAVIAVMQRLTFGDLTDSDDVRACWSASRELIAVGQDRLSNDVLLNAMGLNS